MISNTWWTMFHPLIPPTPYHEKSYAYLSSQQTKTPRYCSKTTRHALPAICEAWMGRKPYPWQLDCAEALILGIDCIILVGTGFGKTLPFMIPLLLHSDKVTIVISPLNALEEDQVHTLGLFITAAHRCYRHAAFNKQAWRLQLSIMRHLTTNSMRYKPIV